MCCASKLHCCCCWPGKKSSMCFKMCCPVSRAGMCHVSRAVARSCCYLMRARGGELLLGRCWPWLGCLLGPGAADLDRAWLPCRVSSTWRASRGTWPRYISITVCGEPDVLPDAESEKGDFEAEIRAILESRLASHVSNIFWHLPTIFLFLSQRHHVKRGNYF